MQVTYYEISRIANWRWPVRLMDVSTWVLSILDPASLLWPRRFRFFVLCREHAGSHMLGRIGIEIHDPAAHRLAFHHRIVHAAFGSSSVVSNTSSKSTLATIFLVVDMLHTRGPPKPRHQLIDAANDAAIESRDASERTGKVGIVIYIATTTAIMLAAASSRTLAMSF